MLKGTRAAVIKRIQPVSIHGQIALDVAVKVLLATYATDPERLRRFEQEAHAAASLNHPNIVAVFDIGMHDSAPYIVEELLHGETLRSKLSQPLSVRKSTDTPFRS